MKKTFVFYAGIAIAALIVLAACSASAQSNPPETPPRMPSPYDPSAYGLPNTVLDYKILAVLTPENTACMTEHSKRVVLQTTQPNLDTYLNRAVPDTIDQSLHHLSQDNIAWEVMIVGPDVTLATFLAENEKWNAQAAKFGCVSSGPVLP